MIEKFGVDGYDVDANIFLVPINVGIDTKYNWPTGTYQVNSHNTDTITFQNNSVHPAQAGYQQVGDLVWGWIVNQ